MKRILIASGNAHKAEEIESMLGSGWAMQSLCGLLERPALGEDQATFQGNVLQKATELALWLERRGARYSFPEPDYILADDSGLEVDALNGAPGVWSARFAAGETDDAKPSDAANNAKLLRSLETVPSERRRARFRCVLALVPFAGQSDRNEAGLRANAALFEGECRGRIIESPRGENGFGYDPLFVPEGFDRTFAELSDEEKNRISHRGQALERMKESLNAA